MTLIQHDVLAVPPLASSLARVGALDSYLTAEIGELESEWFLASTLLRNDAPYLEQALTYEIAPYPGAERRVAGSFFCGHYSWYLVGAAIGCYLAEQRVPDLAMDNVALRYHTYTWKVGDQTGEATRINVRFLSGRFAALPTDAAAHHPDALVMPDQAAMRDWLREQLEQHFTPLIDTLHKRTGLGKRAQWSLVADSCARLFQHAGTQMGKEECGCAEGLAFVKAAGSPLCNRKTGYANVEWNGHRETFCVRGGCCLFYRVNNGERCPTCVLRPEEERNQLLRESLMDKYAPKEVEIAQ